MADFQQVKPQRGAHASKQTEYTDSMTKNIDETKAISKQKFKHITKV